MLKMQEKSIFDYPRRKRGGRLIPPLYLRPWAGELGGGHPLPCLMVLGHSGGTQQKRVQLQLREGLKNAE